jgi:hypothetical protein
MTMCSVLEEAVRYARKLWLVFWADPATFAAEATMAEFEAVAREVITRHDTASAPEDREVWRAWALWLAELADRRGFSAVEETWA